MVAFTQKSSKHFFTQIPTEKNLSWILTQSIKLTSIIFFENINLNPAVYNFRRKHLYATQEEHPKFIAGCGNSFLQVAHFGAF